MTHRNILRPWVTNSPCWKAEMATADATNQRSALLNSGATAAPVSRTITRSRALSLITFGPPEDPESLHAGSEPGEKKTAVEKLRRFTETGEAQAWLRLRARDVSVLAEYLSRGRF